MYNYIMVFIGGGIGAVLRFIITVLSNKFLGAEYPYGTFIINITGSLFLGFVLALAADRVENINPNLIIFLTIGIAGGFTTFSTFSYESLVLIKKGEILSSMSYLFLSPILGLISAYFGTYLARLYNS
ncbi:MAG: hypothetical protein A2104_05970 [Candidatus Melainabacteria bacterium GWF2_32_7]|nr:MAG: hypothetical protein A2104_05970 [Candidatus Melainabacteria bacterium GWF2_32_7]